MKIALGFLGYFTFFTLGMLLLFSALDQNMLPIGRDGESKAPCRYGRWMLNRPFLTSYITLLVLYLPYIVASYPALFMGDVLKTILQVYGIYPLTSHQPPIYTLLFGVLLKLGYALFHAWTPAAFVAAMAQMLFLLAIISAGVQLLVREAALRWEWAAALLAYYVVSMVVSNYMMLLTKDVYYVSFFFLAVQALFCLLKKGWSRRSVLGLAIGTMGILCFRNDGVLVILLSVLLLALFNRKLRKGLLAFAAGTMATYLGLTLLLLPALGVQKIGLDAKSIRDISSIPFQQTARTVLIHRGEISAEEEKIILDAFSFPSLDAMAETYTPKYSDDIKSRFTGDFASAEVKAYFRLWREMGRKYPKSYLVAYLENYYEYFYPDMEFWVYTYEWSTACMDNTNYNLGSDFHHPEVLSGFQHRYEALRDRIYRYPPFSLFNAAGVVTWVMMIWTAWVLYRREKRLLQLMIPAYLVLFFCLFSPCNGYYGRYQYPVFVVLPWILLASKHLFDTTQGGRAESPPIGAA